MRMLAAAILLVILLGATAVPATAADSPPPEALPSVPVAAALLAPIEGGSTIAPVSPVPGMGPVEAIDGQAFSIGTAARMTLVALASMGAGFAIGVRLIQRGL